LAKFKLLHVYDRTAAFIHGADPGTRNILG